MSISVPKPDVPAFPAQAEAALLALRRAVARILASLPLVDRPIRLAELLGIDNSLAWKVWKVGLGEGALPAAAHIPGEAGFARFMSAARRGGASESAVREAGDAHRALLDVMQSHGGDRASGAIMLGFISDAGRMRTELAMRRAALRANAHFLGVQARTLYQLDVLTCDPSGGAPIVTRVRAHFGLKRTRQGVSWLLGRSTPVEAKGPLAVRRRPLAAEQSAADSSPWLLPAFCSSPLPNITRRLVGGVTTEDELAPGAVGESGAVDVVMGEVIDGRAASTAATDAVTMWVSTPCERMCYEVLIERALIRGAVSARVHSTVHGDLPYLRGEHCDSIPVPESFQEMGSADSAGPAVEVPHHAELMKWVIARAGKRPGDLALWRLGLRMPPVPSIAAAVYSKA